MPSIFSSLRATVSKPLQSVLDIEHYIKCNQRTEMLTQQYRKLMNVDTKLAGNIKRQSIAICPSIQFLPKGRTLEYFDKETYWLMLDYDHVISLVLDEKVEKASHSKYAMVVYRTISGKGLRILLKYMRPAGCTLTATELHRLAIDKAMAYFNDLLSINADIQCRDMTRLCGLSHDDKAYFNWNAEPMEITPEEVTKFYNTVVKETLNPDSHRHQAREFHLRPDAPRWPVHRPEDAPCRHQQRFLPRLQSAAKLPARPRLHLERG